MSKKALLDTQAFIFALNSPETIPGKTRKLLSNSETELYLSIASIWEMSIKTSLGKLKFDVPLKELVQTSIKASGLKILPIQPEHIYLVETFPFHHKDPFDRIIIAQSISERMPIISNDSAFDRYEAERIW